MSFTGADPITAEERRHGLLVGGGDDDGDVHTLSFSFRLCRGRKRTFEASRGCRWWCRRPTFPTRFISGKLMVAA
jgi:hypothetical protein